MSTQSKPLIALAVICGNEEAIIRRFIASFAPAIDFAAFVMAIGAQTPDGTEAAIKEECERVGLRYSIGTYRNTEDAKDWPHVDNFGAARERSWAAAAESGATYLMWADCDDVLADGAAKAIRHAAELDGHDVVMMPYWVKPNGEQIVLRERMVRNDGSSAWRYSIHEQLGFKRDMTFTHAAYAIFLHSPLAGKTGASDRNQRILGQATASVARDYFYLHAEHFGKPGQEKMFRKYAEAALAAQPPLEAIERYEVLLNLAQAENGPRAKEWAAMAFAEMPDRREALALLTSYSIVEGEHERALQLCKLMMGIPKPGKTYWTVNHAWYEWKGMSLWLQCLRLNGRHKDAYELEAKMKPKGGYAFSVIHATLGNPQQAMAVREIWLGRARNPLAVEYLFGCHSFDAKSMKWLRGFNHSVTPNKGKDASFFVCSAMATGKIVVQAHDDVIPPQDWDLLLEKQAAEQRGTTWEIHKEVPCFRERRPEVAKDATTEVSK